MNEKLISGYTAYTSADEYGASAVGDAPATPPTLFVSLVTAISGVAVTSTAHC